MCIYVLNYMFDKKKTCFFLCTDIKQMASEDFPNISKNKFLIKGKLNYV